MPVRDALGLRLYTVDDIMERMGIGHDDDPREVSTRDLVSRVFDVVMEECLVPGWLAQGDVAHLPEPMQLARGKQKCACASTCVQVCTCLSHQRQRDC